MDSIQEIIDLYSKGFHYRRLTFDDFLRGIYSYKILEMAVEYKVNPHDYDTSEKEIKDFCNQFGGDITDSYLYYINAQKDNKETNRGCLFCPIVTIILTVFFSLITPYFVITFPLIAFVVWKYIFPPFNERCERRKIEQFMNENNIVSNRNVERFINEVMFQAYVRHRNPVEESKSSKCR